MLKTSFSFFAAGVFLHWGFGVYKNEYFNQATQFITFRGRRSLMEGESVVATSWHLLQPEHILYFKSCCGLLLFYYYYFMILDRIIN